LPNRFLNKPGAFAFAAAAVMAACVSLSSPRGRGEIPVVSGGLKSGSTQLVRILLEAGKDSSVIGATGPWGVFKPGADQPVVTFGADKTTRVMLPGSPECVASGSCTAATLRLPVTSSFSFANTAPPYVVRALDANSFVTWNGKRYRGDIVIGDSGVTNRLSMDSYLRGVVPLEIGNRTAAEFAAVQSQAVAARTYAYKHLTPARDFDMYSTVQDQVYGGVDAEKPQSDSAIATTADVVVLYNGRPITTPYHSTCGGSTAAVSEVWYNQSDEPYLRPVSDKIPGSDKFYCDPSPRFAWKQNYDAESLKAVMEKYLASYTNAPKSGLGRITDIREQGRTKSGRIAALAVQTESGTYTLRGNDIRFVLRDPKGAILNSTYFNFEQAKSNGGVSALNIDGRGYGHGIGMCQWGAIGRARAGQDFRTILETYYPGTTIGRIAG